MWSQRSGQAVRTSVRSAPGLARCRSRTAAVSMMMSPGDQLLRRTRRRGGVFRTAGTDQKPELGLGLGLDMGLDMGLDWGPEPPRMGLRDLRSLSTGLAAALAGVFLGMEMRVGSGSVGMRGWENPAKETDGLIRWNAR